MNKIIDFLAFLIFLAGLAGISVCQDKIYALIACFSAGYFFARYLSLERRIRNLEKKG